MQIVVKSCWKRVTLWVVLVGIAMAMAGSAPVAARALRVGDRMPAFLLGTIGGGTIDSARLKNRAIWLTFFQST